MSRESRQRAAGASPGGAAHSALRLGSVIASRLSLAALLALAIVAVGSVRQTARGDAAPAVDANIEIVWTHDEQGRYAPPSVATLANVEVYLFKRGTLEPVGCDFRQQVRLTWAWNGVGHVSGGFVIAAQTPTEEGYLHGTPLFSYAVGERATRTVAGRTFPVWEFNDVPILPNVLATVTTFFTVEVQGADYRTNVWANNAGPGTYFPYPWPPLKIQAALPNLIDAFIQTVWPHDPLGQPQPIADATLANIAVDIVDSPAEPSDMASVGFGFNQPVRLLQALNNGYLTPVDTAAQVTTAEWKSSKGESLRWPRWQFNDVAVAAARDPRNTYYFAVQAVGVPTHSTIWAYGADARTIFPQRDVPAASGSGCA